MTERGLLEPEWERAGRKVAKDVPNCGMRGIVTSTENEKAGDIDQDRNRDQLWWGTTGPNTRIKATHVQYTHNYNRHSHTKRETEEEEQTWQSVTTVHTSKWLYANCVITLRTNQWSIESLHFTTTLYVYVRKVMRCVIAAPCKHLKFWWIWFGRYYLVQ